MLSVFEGGCHRLQPNTTVAYRQSTFSLYILYLLYIFPFPFNCLSLWMFFFLSLQFTSSLIYTTFNSYYLYNYFMASENNKAGQERPLSHREIKKLVDTSPVLCLYDHEKVFSDQPPGVLDEVEKLLGLENMPWLSEIERAMLLSCKVDRIFCHLLCNHGYVCL